MNHLSGLLSLPSRLVVRLPCLLTIIVAVTVLFGWIAGIPVLSSFGTQIKPMSPISGALFIFYSIMILLKNTISCNGRALNIYRTALSIAVVLSALCNYLTLSDIETLIAHQNESINDILQHTSLLSMSPLSACCFLCCGISLLLLCFPTIRYCRRCRMQYIFTGFIISTGIVFLAIYILGTPFLYKNGFIPPSLPSSCAFITMGTALLFAGQPQWEHLSEHAAGHPSTENRFMSLLVPIFMLSSVGILIAGYLYFINYRNNFMANVKQSLSTIANLKVDGLVQWRNERLGDATTISENESFAWLLKKAIDKPSDTTTLHLLRAWIKAVATTFTYEEIFICDTSGTFFCSTRDTNETVSSPIPPKALATVLTKRKTLLFDLHRDEPDKPIHLTTLAPIFETTNKKKWLGIIAFRINPETFLYPYLREWPSKDMSAEVLLVRREGNDVLFLNDLKYQNHAALSLHIPLDKHSLPAAMAVQGKTGFVMGYDYRNVPVLAALHKIPDSPWFLVARIDKSEIEAPLQKHLWLTAGIICMILFTFSIGFGALWLYRKSRYYQEKSEITEALARSEVLLRTIFGNVSDGIAAIDITTGTCIIANTAMYNLLGCSLGDLPELAITDRLLPEHRTTILNQCRSDKSERTLLYDSPVRRTDGSIIFTDISATAVNLDEKSCVLCVIRDVSERKTAREKISYHEMLLQQMGTMTKTGGWEFETSTGKGTWTEEVAKIHDLDPEDPTNRDIGLSFYRGDSRDKIEKAIHEAIVLGKGYDLELELVTAKGTCKWVRTIGQPLFEDGKVYKIRGSFQDITDQKKNENHILHLNNVLHGIRNVNKLITHEKNRDILIQQICNQLVETRGFYTAALALTDTNNEKVVNVANAGVEFPGIYERFHSGFLPDGSMDILLHDAVTIVKNQITSRSQDSETATEAETMIWKLQYEKKIFGFILVTLPPGMRAEIEEQNLLKEGASDIAFALHSLEVEEEHARSAEALVHSEQQLRQSQKLEAIGQLAGGIAHDFNNIISAILGYCDLIEDNPSYDSTITEHIKQIIQCSERAASLTRQLLTFSRKQIATPMALNLNTIIVNLEKMLCRLIGEDIELCLHLMPDIGTIKADPNHIEQILMNLIVNSRDAMPSGGKLIIETANMDLDDEYSKKHIEVIPGRYSMLSISDTGCGIEASVRERIFEPFFTTKERGKGTGLGLSTVYGIVKQAGGTIWCYSEPGKGTTFKIFFPQSTTPVSIEPPSVVSSVAMNGTETVLLSEDENDVRDVASSMLNNAGYHVIVAANGFEAIKTCTDYTETIHLLITDVVMPGMSGKQLAEQVSKIHPETKVLYTSGYTDNIIEHHGIIEEHLSFLQKPYNKQLLLTKVREVLDAHDY